MIGASAEQIYGDPRIDSQRSSDVSFPRSDAEGVERDGPSGSTSAAHEHSRVQIRAQISEQKDARRESIKELL